MQRESREYSKRDLVYCHEDIFKTRQRIEHSSELEHSREENPAEELSVSDVKDKLKSLGVKTRLRNEQKLKRIFEETH